MRCTTCDYPLWRTSRRTCPECGSAFRVGDHAFRPGAVRFRCPHCSQSYYGTTERGQLDPPAFECTCGQRISVEEMTIEPALGVDENATDGAVNPWVDRERIGLFRAWIRSVFAILGGPAGFIRSVPAAAPVSEAVLFAGVSALCSVAFGLVMLGAGYAVATIFAGSLVFRNPASILLTVSFQFVYGILGLVCAILAGFVAHAVLVVLRSARVGLGRSVPAILYTQGATAAISLVACCPCNSAVAPVWWCISMTAMLRVLHGVSLGRALTASIIAALTWIGASGGASLAVGMTLPVARTSTVAVGGAISGEDLRGATGPYETPFHAVLDDSISIDDLLDLIAPDDESLRLAGLSRDELSLSTSEANREIAARLSRLLPSDRAPFRLGRAIFLYRDAPDERSAWHVLVEPPTRPKGTTGLVPDLWIVHRRRGTTVITGADFPAKLAAENANRTKAGLPPIPDPGSLPDLLADPSMAAPLERPLDGPAGAAPTNPGAAPTDHPPITPPSPPATPPTTPQPGTPSVG